MLTNLRGKYPAFDDGVIVKDPDNHAFFVLPGKNKPDPVSKVVINVQNLNDSVIFWRDLCGMSILETSGQHAILSFGENQVCVGVVLMNFVFSAN